MLRAFAFAALLIVVACLPEVGPPVPDGGERPDGGGGAGGRDAGCVGFAGCAVFSAGTTIDFGIVGFSYSPKCLRVSAGQMVTFNGTFANHPLRQACGPAQVLERTTGSSAQFTLTVPGSYGFYCGDHGDGTGAGMAGAIEVVP